jgi:hypothetical protein
MVQRTAEIRAQLGRGLGDTELLEARVEEFC